MGLRYKKSSTLVKDIFLENDIYILQHVPSSPFILVNLKYSGVQIIDPGTGQEVSRFKFPPMFAKSGAISNLCLRADGEATIIFDDEAKKACWLSLISQHSYSYDFSNFPNWVTTHDLRYVWEGNQIWITAGKSYELLSVSLTDEAPHFILGNNITVRRSFPLWSRIQSTLSPQEYNVLRVQMDRQHFYYHHYKTVAPTVGIKNWEDGSQQSILVRDEFHRFAYLKGYFFLMQEFEVHVYNEQNEQVDVYVAPQGFRFVDLDTVMLTDDSYYVVLGCHSENSYDSQLLVYEILLSNN